MIIGNDNGNSNKDYTNPNEKASQYITWVQCNPHNRWHPKDHTDETNGLIGGIIS